ncbi:RNA methyltransferase, TrmH family [invertebrate metagenome]|uniref:RNA methyltransferase, TrmH family n=1 Tax=invertebrate metagenome TaxID=1711999 RepID=A0A484HCM5_9ZZZZ
MALEAEQRLACRVLTSLRNPAVKLVRALSLRKTRRKSGLFVAEGMSIVATAMRYGWVPRLILMSAERTESSWIRTKLINWAIAHGVICLALSEPVFAKVATRNNPQDLLAVFVQRWGVPPIGPGRTELWIALENIRDPGNLGTIIRTIDATGIGGICLIGSCCDPYAREAVRASMGSIFHVPLVRMDKDTFLQWRTTWPGDVIGTHLSAREDFRQRYKAPVLLLMGSEGSGLSAAMAKVCTRLVRIPMVGHIDSLNLAIATALMVYEIRRDALFLQD